MTIGSVDGLVSGMSTSQVIEQLVSAEGAGQNAIKNRVTAAQKTVTAMQSINTKLSALGTAASALTAYRAFNPVTATSSSDAVVATATAGASTGSLTFDVKNLASAELHASDNAYALNDVVAGGSLTITKNGTSTSINTGDGRLETVVSAINSSNSGVRAAAVQVSAGQYRLQLTATTTGAVSDFSVAGLTVTESELVAGADATLHIGPAGGGYDVTSSTNTFAGVMPGVTFTAKKVESAVTVDVATDAAAVTKKVGDLVKAANDALAEIKTQSAFNAVSSKSGPLASDYLARQLSSSITSAVAQGVGGASLSAYGIELTRDGTITFDEDKFQDKLEADPSSVQRMLGSSGSYLSATNSTGGIQTLSTGSKTKDGPHAINITQAATQATASYDIPSVVAGETYSFTLNNTTVSYTANGTDGLAEVTAGLRSAASTAGVNLAVSQTASGIDFVAGPFGAGQVLTLGAAVGATSSTTAGQDVQGTIDGIAARGSGQSLSTAGVTGATSDLSLIVTLNANDLALGNGIGNVTVTAGLAQRLDTFSKGASNSADGSVTLALKRRQDQIQGYNDDIAAWDVRLDARRNALKIQFANMETALGKLKNQSSWLAGQIAGLPS